VDSGSADPALENRIKVVEFFPTGRTEPFALGLQAQRELEVDSLERGVGEPSTRA
jgi:hypothetical protein